jgi:hypothetical protein
MTAGDVACPGKMMPDRCVDPGKLRRLGGIVTYR